MNETTKEPAEHVLARHQMEGPLPYGFVCLCGRELPDLNPPVTDATIYGRALALAVHQLEMLTLAGWVTSHE